MSLESYIEHDYRTDKRQLLNVYQAMNEVLPLFAAAAKLTSDHLGADNTNYNILTWPYRIEAGQAVSAISVDRFSPSTHSMILLTLDAFHPLRRNSVLITERIVPPEWRFANRKVKSKLLEVINKAKWNLIELASSDTLNDDNWLTESQSYGRDDPLTLTWFIELANRCMAKPNDSKQQKSLEKCRLRLHNAALRALKRVDEKHCFLNLENLTAPKHYEVSHPFWRLRYGHLRAAAERLSDETKENVASIPQLDSRDFETTLHDHLSFWGIGDPRFDPAQLAFSLEGIVRHNPSSLNEATIKHIFKVLGEYQDREPCWRPVAPVLATERGLSLFPLTAEIGNSILRTCELLDRGADSPRHFSGFESHLRKYVSWLLTRIEHFPAEQNSADDQPRLAGWHSDHVEERGTIHLWQTSQVVLFLLHYASLLQRKIAADGLEAANIRPRSCSSIRRLKTFWSEEPLTIVESSADRTPESNCHYAVLAQVRTEYIEAREKSAREKLACSILLYGPPGTGKTTVAEQMAAQLGWPLIIITVSDFLARGAAEIEARAKCIFTVLCEQRDAVILFDEIDQFLLDRNSGWYRDQDDIFKFMTPGMLTKLQDLRDAAASVFIVATNYYERIDGAIKRRGRIDDHLHLSLPDWGRRKYFIQRFAIGVLRDKAKELSKSEIEANPLFNECCSLPEDYQDDENLNWCRRDLVQKFGQQLDEKGVGVATIFFGYGDLKNLVENKLDRTLLEADLKPDELADAILRATKKVDPSVRLDSYQSRFHAQDRKLRDEPPTEEFYLLTYLRGELGSDTLKETEREALTVAVKNEPISKQSVTDKLQSGKILEVVANLIKESGIRTTDPDSLSTDSNSEIHAKT